MPVFNPFDSGATATAEAPAGGFDPFSEGGATETVDPKRIFPEHLSFQTQDPEAHWRNIYGGLEGLDSRVDASQRAAFTKLDYVSPDPQEQRARAINQTFVGEKLRMAHPALESNWDAVKSSFAKEALGIDAAQITDKALYGWIGRRMKPAESLGDETGEIKPWTWQDTLSWDVRQIGRSAGKLWDSISIQPLDKLPDAPANLPNNFLMGAVSPAMAGAIWNGY